MAATGYANGRKIVHRKSGYQHLVFPDVCKTPGVGPIPYPNLGQSKHVVKGPMSVSVDSGMPYVDGAEFSKSTLDEPGRLGGVISNTYTDICEPLLFSFDVQMEGKGVVREGDLLWHNKRNIFG